MGGHEQGWETFVGCYGDDCVGGEADIWCAVHLYKDWVAAEISTRSQRCRLNAWDAMEWGGEKGVG